MFAENIYSPYRENISIFHLIRYFSWRHLPILSWYYWVCLVRLVLISSLVILSSGELAEGLLFLSSDFIKHANYLYHGSSNCYSINLHHGMRFASFLPPPLRRFARVVKTVQNVGTNLDYPRRSFTANSGYGRRIIFLKLQGNWVYLGAKRICKLEWKFPGSSLGSRQWSSQKSFAPVIGDSEFTIGNR